MARRSARECARALWLLGLVPPVSAREVNAAWRARVARTHPDLHAASAKKVEAAETLTRALNDAKDALLRWIEEGRRWRRSAGGRASRRPRPSSRTPPGGR